MTSSLVGSEMCIRDRYNCEKEGVKVKRGKDGYHEFESYRDVGVAKKMLCLLYTSDAADDM
eukprot:7909939-Prorocentrum_lima.AAC.1